MLAYSFAPFKKPITLWKTKETWTFRNLGTQILPGYIFSTAYNSRRIHAGKLQLRNRKHFLHFYQFIETQLEVWENKKCCGNTSRRRVFRQLFQVLPNLHECFYNSIETRRKCFLFLLENSPWKITKNKENLIVLFIIKM